MTQRPTDLSASPLCQGRSLSQFSWKLCLKLMEEREVIWENQHGFTKGRSCLTNLVSL